MLGTILIRDDLEADGASVVDVSEAAYVGGYCDADVTETAFDEGVMIGETESMGASILVAADDSD